MYSPSRATRSFGSQSGTPIIGYERSPTSPVPSPISSRPPETWSSVSAWRANIAGLRRGIWVTHVPIRSRVVAAASPVSAVQDSNHGLDGLVQSTKWSGSAADSRPSASSRTNRSRSSGHGTVGRHRTWKRTAPTLAFWRVVGSSCSKDYHPHRDGRTAGPDDTGTVAGRGRQAHRAVAVAPDGRGRLTQEDASLVAARPILAALQGLRGAFPRTRP